MTHILLAFWVLRSEWSATLVPLFFARNTFLFRNEKHSLLHLVTIHRFTASMIIAMQLANRSAHAVKQAVVHIVAQSVAASDGIFAIATIASQDIACKVVPQHRPCWTECIIVCVTCASHYITRWRLLAITKSLAH